MSVELDVLRAEIAELRLAVSKLQQAPARPTTRASGGWLGQMFVLMLGFIAGRALLSVSVSQQPGPKDPLDVVCRSLKLVGPDGKERVMLTVDKEGGVVRIFANDGKERGVLAVAPGRKNGRL